MTLRWEPDGHARGEVALVHGVMALADTWWRVGPALAARGWRVAAIDLSGHGGDRRHDGALDLGALVDGVLEEPPAPGSIDLSALAAVIAQDAAAVRRDRAPLVARERDANARWDPGDVERSVRGIEEADAPAIVAALNGPLRWDLSALLAGVGIPALVLAGADVPGTFPLDPGSALRGGDRDGVRDALAPERFVVLDGGHCLHRDDAARWVEVVDGFASATLG